MRNEIHNADIIKFLPTLPDRSCDLFLLDPPYMNVVNEDWDKQWRSIDEYLDWCEKWISEVSRISKYSGSVWVFGFPYQLSMLIPIFERYGFKFKQQVVIWKGMKSAAGRVSSKLKMYPTTTESAFLFYYDSTDVIRKLLNVEKDRKGLTPKEINEYLGKASWGGGTWSSIAGLRQKTLMQPTREDWTKLDILFDGRLPAYDDMVYKFNMQFGLTDVWDDIVFYFKKGTKFHPTQKPDMLVDRIIKTSSVEGDLVIDFFMGSGSSLMGAKRLGRDYLGVDIDQRYFWLVEQRLKDSNFELPEGYFDGSVREKGKKRKKELIKMDSGLESELDSELDLE